MWLRLVLLEEDNLRPETGKKLEHNIGSKIIPVKNFGQKCYNIFMLIKNKIILSTLILIFFPSIIMAEFVVSDFKYKKNIINNSTETGLFSFVIDNEIYKNGNQFFHDLRIVDKNNREIPYLIKKEFDQVNSKSINRNLKIISKKNNIFILDMGKVPKYNKRISIITKSFDFSRIVDVYGSNLIDSRFENLTLAKQGDLIAVVPGNNDKNIDFRFNNYRYIKLVFSGNEGSFVPLEFTVEEIEQEKILGKKEIFNLKINDISDENSKNQKIILESSGENIPIDSIILHSTERDFSRSIRIYSSNHKNAELLENNKRYDKNTNYWKNIYSGRFSERVYSKEQVFNINDNKKYYLIIINNKDNENLNITGATATRFLNIVYLDNLDFVNNYYRVFYGNIFAKKPNYDLSNINQKINIKNSTKVFLSEEKDNKDYVAPKEKLGMSAIHLIYMFIGGLMLILVWFVYKVIRETENKDKTNKKSFIGKL